MLKQFCSLTASQQQPGPWWHLPVFPGVTRLIKLWLHLQRKPLQIHNRLSRYSLLTSLSKVVQVIYASMEGACVCSVGCDCPLSLCSMGCCCSIWWRGSSCDAYVWFCLCMCECKGPCSMSVWMFMTNMWPCAGCVCVCVPARLWVSVCLLGCVAATRWQRVAGRLWSVSVTQVPSLSLPLSLTLFFSPSLSLRGAHLFTSFSFNSIT